MMNKVYKEGGEDTDQNAIITQSQFDREAIQTVTLPLADSFMDESNIIAKKQKVNKLDQIKERLSIENIALYLEKIDSLERMVRSQQKEIEDLKTINKFKYL